jgi:S-layer homology domain
MVRLYSWQSSTALLMALSITTGAVAPLVMQAPAEAQSNSVSFSDVSSNYWAEDFISELANRGIIRGFPDGTFRPNELVTRAQFAAMVRQAFEKSPTRSAINFVDVPSNYWAYSAIQEAYTIGFLSGYPGNVFNPGQNIPRAQVLVSLANGLGYTSNGTNSLGVYRDAAEIPNYAQGSIAAATQRSIVVNYPNVEFLNPNREATRAEVAAFIYQALVSTGNATALSSPYIVGQSNPQPTTPQAVQIPTGTTLPTRYEDAEKILISLEEPDPVPVTLQIERDVVSQSGTVLIPANSQVVGEMRLVEGGTQFYASELVLTNGTRLNLNATSRVINTTEEVRRGANVRELLTGAVLGSAAAAGVAGVTGDRAIATEEVLGGTAAGTLLSFFLGRDRVTLYSVDPNADLDITLNAPLALR